MKLTLAEPTYLKESISILSDLVSEARFTISKDAVELVAMDPANVAMVVFKLLSSCFTEYDVPENAQLSIHLGNLKQILRRCGANDMVTLELAGNKLKIQLRGGTVRTFNLPLLDLEEKEHKIPDLQFPVSIALPSSTLTGAIEDADIVAESVSFEAEKDTFTMRASGDLSEAKIEISGGDHVTITSPEEKVQSKYSIEYLKKMIGGSKLSEQVTLEFNKDYPLKLTFKEVDKFLLSFILAPRVEND